VVASERPSAVSQVRRRTTERRRQLIQLSSQGMLGQGYESFSVNDLAAAAGLSVGGLYRYISTKSDLLVMACEDIYDGLHEALLKAVSAAAGSEDQVRSAFALYLSSCADTRDEVMLLYREYKHLPVEAQSRFKEREAHIADLFAALIAQGQASGVFGDLDPAVVAQDMILLGHLPALKGWAVRSLEAGRLATEQVDLLLRALTAGRSQTSGERVPRLESQAPATEQRSRS